MAQNDGTLIMENARIIWRNFAGKEGQYNREGDRNFNVVLEEELARQMIEDGWNVKFKEPRNEEEDGLYTIQVSVGFKGRPPRMVMIGGVSGRRTELGEDECEMLDWADIANVDLIIRPYNWEVNGKTGVKAYLKSIFVTINEDYLELKYGQVPNGDDAHYEEG